MVILSSLWLGGCGPSATAVYGRGSNADRVKRGLPVIPASWIERGGGPQADWNNPDHADARTTNAPMHSYKDTFIDRTSGMPLKETDYYQSGKWYPGLWHDPDDPNDKKLEILSITYDFEAERSGKNPWHCEVNAGPHARMPSGEVPLDEAEAMLKEWGLKRLD
jgi:hypothetical protein